MNPKVTILLFASCLCFSLNSMSQTPSKKQKIERLVKISADAELVKRMMDNYIQAFKSMADQSKVKNKAKYAEFTSFLMSESSEIANRILYKEMPIVYDKYFTEKEIDDILRFNSSSTGKKVMNVTPLMQAYLSQIMLKTEFPKLKEKLSKKLFQLRQN